MSEEDKSQKTEQPTQQRIEKAREKGQIASSREVAHSFVLLAFTMIIGAVVPLTFPSLMYSLSFFLEHSHEILNTGQSFHIILLESGKILAFAFGFPVLLLVVATLGAGYMQTKLKISFENIQPKFSKLSPFGGLKRLFGLKALVEFSKNLFKVGLISGITFWILLPEVRQVVRYQSLSLNGLITSLHNLILHLFEAVLLCVILLAGADYAWQKFQLMRSMRMSRQEIKDESKEQEGDPQIKGRLRQLRQERARQRMMQQVPQATMIITNPTHYAVALKYETEKMAAPRVIAKGIDFMAQRIREIAAEHEIPLIENPTLARALHANVEVDDEIPLEYYEVVAKIIRQLLSKGQIKLDL